MFYLKLNYCYLFQDEIILGDLPPLVSASVLHSGTDSNTYGSAVSGATQKPKASTDQIEALIEPRISNGTQVINISKFLIIG